ncbi:hypothetical protein SEA_ANNADREAMY_197 [Streptomyces phage Annadreamy]|uniref:Uncharacterized protein n=2 Tax=Annadreamyvirus annadreamy TaxID=2846392 RepID=A0A345GTL0_9CAUD|nr:hypothetical protein HWB75_gp081 [Streptomyces phage Annadreamy]AXG66282.1 hypothetical protein SEA_ANNADREAMY_197 [Streptomyces phage Annadreamy]QGH79505.1 hypothetical protein SEA_LIMPID_204 [Streptomyces phage Limpid]
MNEEFDIREFERYLSDGWSLTLNYYTLHGERGFWGYLWDETDSIQTKYGLVERVNADTDYDEGREERTMVVKIGDRYFQKTGYYDSWDSTYWDGRFVEVKPVQKTITDYVII